jgi:hypothetical protein
MFALATFIAGTGFNISGIQNALFASVCFVAAGVIAVWAILTAAKAELSRKNKWLLIVLVTAGVIFSILLTRAEQSGRRQRDQLAIRVAELESVNKGLVQMGSPVLQVRLAGITSLVTTALESDSERGEIMRTFVSYLHDSARYPVQQWERQPRFCTERTDPCQQERLSTPTPSDMQAILNGIKSFQELNPQANLRFEEIDFKKGSLRGTDLRSVTFYRTNLRCFQMREANLNDAHISNSNLAWSDFEYTVGPVTFTDCDLTGAQFSDATLKCVGDKCTRFVGTSLVRAKFHTADLRGATFVGTDVGCAVFDNANLAGADLSGAQHLDCKQIQRSATKPEDVKLPTYLNDCR